jgi:hypothetical protein
MRIVAAVLKIFVSITAVIGALSAAFSFWDINFFKISEEALPYVIPGGVALFLLAVVLALLELRVEHSEKNAQKEAKLRLGSELIRGDVVANIVSLGYPEGLRAYRK